MSRSTVYRRAAEWVVILETCDDLEAQWPRFEAWLAKSPKHEIAYQRAAQEWAERDRLKELLSQEAILNPGSVVRQLMHPSRSTPKPRSLRILLPTVLVGTVVVACLTVALQSWPRLPESGYHTDYGDHRRVSFPEGSTVELNTDSRVRAQLGFFSRRVILEQGEAFFEVAHERRPFSVIVDDTVFSVRGTKFLIRRVDAEKADVLVTQGTVQVARKDPHASQESAPAQTPLGSLHTGEMATVSADGITVTPESASEVNRILAWRQGLLSLDCTLAAAVEEFNRYNNRKLKIADASIAQTPVLGTFRATDPDAFVEKLTQKYKIKHVLVGATNAKDGVIVLAARDERAQ